MSVLLETRLPLKLHSKGKVRDTYDLGDKLLMVTTDRLSAFDVVFGQGIPKKGAVLTQLSAFWFDKMKDVIGNHVISSDVNDFPEELKQYADQLEGRSMLVKKAEPVKAECIVRGYITGSGWKDYKSTGSVCGIKLPEGLVESQKLPEPLFTPSTKGEIGEHDMNVSKRELDGIVGKEVADQLQEVSLKVYERAAGYALEKGIIIADTKFEFGMAGGELVWIDEALTPDSSRFWPASDYEAGRPQKSFDKQFLRDWASSTGWNKEPPAPEIPKEIIEGTSKRYVDAYEMVTGKKFEW